MIRSLFLVFALAGLAVPAAGEAFLPVPFLPQTEALCGGAAAAMVYRYWGDRHADVQQFAPLVDRRAGGIRDTDLVAAIRDKGWHAEQTAGSLESIRNALAHGQPPLLLIEDRPSRYHFVVGVGLTETDIVVHDPTWGPARRLAIPDFNQAWAAARFWMLVVTPGPLGIEGREDKVAPPPPAAARPMSACDRLLDAALDEIEAQGLAAADRALASVRATCPQAPGPIRELAGIRLAQSRAAEAAVLARDALRLDDADRYAWDVLGSSLFVEDDIAGALRAWNHIEKPMLDRVDIRGLTRTRYALVAALTGLQANTLLTARAFALAGRRLEQLPDRVTSGLTLRPDADGYATVVASVQETSRRPHGAIEWGAAGVETAINREIVANIAGWSGQGELWSASWRWWQNRPRVAGGFVAPVVGRLPGVWRVEAAWDAQTYEVAGERIRNDRRTALLTVSHWLGADTRYSARVGLEAWDAERRTLATGASLEQRLFGDRLALTGSLDYWLPFDNGPGFSGAAALLAFRSGDEARGTVLTTRARIETASADAPFGVWSGAGEGRGRPGLMRAHRLLHEGVIDGPLFGRRSGSTNLELQRWFPTQLAALGVAGFTDIGAAAHRLPGAAGAAVLVDVGVGLRARLPGRPGTLRIDYARGVRDKGQRISAGWDIVP